MSQLIISQILDGQKKQLAQIVSDRILIGRSPAPKGIALKEKSISSTHGLFFEAGGAWFFRDLNSTNGTFFENKPLSANSIHLLKTGDVLRLASVPINIDLAFDLQSKKITNLQRPHVYIFWHDQFFEFLPLTPNSEHFVGGGNSQVVLPTEFVIDNEIKLTTVDSGVKLDIVRNKEAIFVNEVEQPTLSSVTLGERAVFSTGPLLLIYTNGHEIHTETNLTVLTESQVSADSLYAKRSVSSSSFGKILSTAEEQENEKIKTAGLKSSRHSIVKDNGKDADKIIYAVAFFMLLIALFLLVWMVLFL